jgi:hypothetical protein
MGEGIVNAEPVFVDQPKVINGCSDLLVEVSPKPLAMRVRPACPTALWSTARRSCLLEPSSLSDLTPRLRPR